MNKEFVLNTIQASKTWEAGQCLSFRHTICGNEWDLIIRKEENIYFPYTISVSGRKVGSPETMRRRYTDAETAFMHIMNDFNENANIKNRFGTLDSALEKLA